MAKVSEKMANPLFASAGFPMFAVVSELAQSVSFAYLQGNNEHCDEALIHGQIK